jgi:hypothetical protein
MNDDRLTFRDVLHALALIAGSIAFWCVFGY